MTKEIPSTQFYVHTGAAIDAARSDTVIVTSHGRPQVAIMSHAAYEALEADRHRLRGLEAAARARKKALSEGAR